MAAASSSAGGGMDRDAAARARGKGDSQSSAYQRQLKGDRSSRGARVKSGGIFQSAGRARTRQQGESFDKSWGYDQLAEGVAHVGYLVNMQPTTVAKDDRIERSGIDLYYLKQDGTTFKTTLMHEPYFYVACKPQWSRIVVSMLTRKFEGVVSGIDAVEMEDLDLPNHLSGIRALYLRLRFRSVGELMDVRNEVQQAVRRNRARAASTDVYEDDEDDTLPDDFMDALSDMREYDVPYVTRCAIDCDLRVGAWYDVAVRRGEATVKRLKEFVEKAEPRVLAFDIECTKERLKFPDARTDQVYMISAMVDGHGYLIINREIVSEDIPDFEYTPKKQFPGPFTVMNVPTEKETIQCFYDLCKRVRPQVYVTYNGDWFDWPFMEKRSAVWGIDMEEQIGVREMNGEYLARAAVHMDCLYWVKRDSYLPQGSHGLKAVTRYKLGYDPVEIDPEDMLKMAVAQPRHMASYSVSDAVATYYLYMKYVHNFVFSLCTIIPLGADDVLRKGSGTLCEMLLQVEAHAVNVIAPNKQVTARGATYEGHLLETETYIGGHVESLESGVFRSDLPVDWKLDASAFEELIGNLDAALKFALEVEEGVDLSEVANYRAVRRQIVRELEKLRDRPVRNERPSIYHLDVAAMYPNIILSNRLQPSAVVSPETCAKCEFNTADNAHQCKRTMEWLWRGEYFPASRAETEMIRLQLETEMFKMPPSRWELQRAGSRFGAAPAAAAEASAAAEERFVPYGELPADEKDRILHERLKSYCRKQYKHVKDTKVERREATICQRENPFYIDTVRAFRDRRYEYKGLTKQWSKKLAAAEKAGDKMAAEAARNRVVLFDSLQLAHKCILNSFYGYVMRKGSRWFSMEMGGVVTNTGASLITQARKLVERIGRPLELDTDGIWCILPSSFPEDFEFELKSGRKVTVSYPCIMLNVDVHDRYTNHQYQTLVNPASLEYATRSECSIYFEVDGPYRCMVLPASQEEGKLLKKRYAVFNFDGSLAELKGFELKRRGELKIIKIFQKQVFSRFLEGASLPDCYANVAAVADYWLDVLETRGEDLEDDELMDLIGEARSMSKTLEEYGSQKSTAISTARRLAEFLGAEMIKDKGLNCNLLIAKKPEGAPVTVRAIPRDIFSAEPAVKKHFLRKWLKDPAMSNFDVRAVVDWDYYIDRLGKAIQKIITIPAALQRVANPVPRVRHPDWLLRFVRQKNDPRKQRKLGQYFAIGDAPVPETSGADVGDIEDFGSSRVSAGALGKHVARVRAMGAAAPGQEVQDASAASAARADGAEVAEDDDEQDDDDQGGPEFEDDVAGWIASRSKRYARKKRSRQAVAVRSAGGYTKRGAMEVAAAPRLRSGLGGGLAGYMDDIADQLATGYLQILEIRETESPGEMRMWAMPTSKMMATLTLRVPRRMLINCIKPVKSLEARRRAMTLPHGRRALNLYEICRSEASFQHLEAELRSSQSNPLVEGVYESQTPLLMRALVDVGCVVSVRSEEDDERRREALLGRTASAAARMRRQRRRQSVLGRPSRRSASASGSAARGGGGSDDVGGTALLLSKPGGDDGSTFIPDHFDFLPAGTHPYLEPTSASIRRAFLFHHSTDSRDGARGITLLGLIHETSAQEALKAVSDPELAGRDSSTIIGGVEVPVKMTVHAFVVVPGAARSRQRGGVSGSLPHTQAVFSKLALVAQLHRANTVSIQNHLHSTMGEMWTAAASTLGSFTQRNSGPFIVSTASSLPKRALVGLVPLLGSYPVVHRALSPAEASPLPPMAWQDVAATRAVSAFAGWFTEWPSRLNIARYLQTPVGNLEGHVWSGAIDLFYARLLRTNNHALWMSPTRLPDLGGAELRNETDSLLELRPFPTFDWASGFRSAVASHAQAKAASGQRGGRSAVDSHVADLASSASGTQVDPRASPSVNRPGAYRRVCVDLELSHLALNTVLHADLIADGGAAGDVDVEAMQGGLTAEAAADVAAGLLDYADPSGSGSQCRAAFHWLQVMVASWHRDMKQTHSPHADELLRNLYEWLASPASKLYDSALHRMVRALMTKVWQQLLTEMRRLGAVVVHASFDRVTLATPKTDPAAAFNWTAYMLKNIESRPIFSVLQLLPTWFSAGMLWLDDVNMSSLEIVDPKALVAADKLPALLGLAPHAPLEEEEAVDASLHLLHAMQLVDDHGLLITAGDDEHEEDGGDSDLDERAGATPPRELQQQQQKRQQTMLGGDRGGVEDGFIEQRALVAASGTKASPAEIQKGFDPATMVRMASSWNIAGFLPPRAEQAFLELVELFLSRPFTRAWAAGSRQRKSASSSSSSAAAASASAAGEATGMSRAAAADALLLDAVRRVLTRVVSARAHTAVQDLRAAGGDDMAFPDRPGKHLRCVSPALEFAKTLCFVLSLDGSVAEESARLRKSVLRLLGVADFSTDAVWRDPCLTYVLPDVVCQACKHTRDLDVCRDVFVTEPSESERLAGAREAWHCPNCQQTYDTDEIELALVTTLQQRSAAFQLQDLYCSKSRAIRTDRLSDVSPSSARWVNAENPDRFCERLTVFTHIARHHGMEWLASEAAFLLGEHTADGAAVAALA